MMERTHRQRPCLLSSTSCSSSRNSSDWIVLSRDMITSPTSCRGRRLQLLVVDVRNRVNAPGAAFRATPHSAISLAATNEAPRLAHLLAGHRVRPREVLLIADSVVRMSSKSCSEVSGRMWAMSWKVVGIKRRMCAIFWTDPRHDLSI